MLEAGRVVVLTVNSEIIVRILFSRIALKDIFFYIKIARLGHGLPISENDSRFSISRGFYFRETSHLRSFEKINPRQNFRIYSSSQEKLDQTESAVFIF